MAASQSAGRVSIASDVRKPPWTSDMHGDARSLPRNAGQGRDGDTSAAVRLSAATGRSQYAKLGGRCVTAAHRGPRDRGQHESSLVTEGASRTRAGAALRPPSTRQVGIKHARAAVRAQRRLDAAHERLAGNWGCLVRRAAGPFRNFAGGDSFALQQSMPESACMPACSALTRPDTPDILPTCAPSLLSPHSAHST